MATVIATMGVAMLLGAYAAATTGRLPHREVYFGLNVVGSVLAAIGSALVGFLPFVVLEAAWAGIGIKGFIGARREERHA